MYSKTQSPFRLSPAQVSCVLVFGSTVTARWNKYFPMASFFGEVIAQHTRMVWSGSKFWWLLLRIIVLLRRQAFLSSPSHLVFHKGTKGRMLVLTSRGQEARSRLTLDRQSQLRSSLPPESQPMNQPKMGQNLQ